MSGFPLMLPVLPHQHEVLWPWEQLDPVQEFLTLHTGLQEEGSLITCRCSLSLTREGKVSGPFLGSFCPVTAFFHLT